MLSASIVNINLENIGLVNVTAGSYEKAVSLSQSLKNPWELYDSAWDWVDFWYSDFWYSDSAVLAQRRLTQLATVLAAVSLVFSLA